MNHRPTFEEIYQQMATLMSRRSTCSRLSVGAIITTEDFRRVLSCGYNGNASGLDNCCDRSQPGNCGCLHAEMNAVINCAERRSEPKIVFVTHLPCETCAKALINLGGVKRVQYATEYRTNSSLDLFKRANIEIVRLNF